MRQLFKFSKIVLLLEDVTKGKIVQKSTIRVMRDNDIILETKIDSLKRFKEDVKEVKEGFECGIVIEDNVDIKEGDIIVAYKVEQKRLNNKTFVMKRLKRLESLLKAEISEILSRKLMI